MVNRVARILLVLAITLTCLIQSPISLRTYADDGITKTATAVTATCPGATTTQCTGGRTYTTTHTYYCSCGKVSHGSDTYSKCSACGGTLSVTISYWPAACSSCNDAWTGESSSRTEVWAGFGHKTSTTPCTHGQTSSHTFSTGTYINSTYGYSGTSSVFKVYPIAITAKNGFTGTVSVTGCTATDAAMSGKSVTVKVTGVTSGTKLKITNSGTGATVTPTPTSTSYNYTFTMPSKATTITIELAQVAQSIAASLSSSTVGYGSRPTLAVTGAKTALSHASSNTSVASIDTSGNITLNGLGSTTFTITAAESSDYYSASTTVTLTVVKGNLSTKTAPACSSINYGQVLLSSTLSGGSVINESSTAVDGTWSWKTPTTVPNAGKFAFTATYKPVDTAHYNY